MTTIKRMVLAAALALSITAPMMAEEEVRYIVILKQRTGAAPDLASLGGRVEWRQEEQLVVSIPAGAEAKLKADPQVLYIERVRGGEAAAEGPLLGTPAEPEAGVSATATRLKPRTLGNTPWDSGTYSYDGAGNIIGIGSDTYAYDEVQRLKRSTTMGTIETYTYDGFGNMLTKTNTTIPTVLTAFNRYQGYSYNDIGAVTSDGSYTFSYDALGQPLSKSYNGGNLEYYVYTPSDERIGVQRGSWWNWSVRDEGGKVLRQYRSSSTSPEAPALWVEDFVWRDGLLLGSQRPVEMGGRRHYHLDHLGTPRLVTSEDGHAMSLHDYLPFGDEKTPVVQEGPGAAGFDREEPMKFTGHERDFAGGFGAEDSHSIDYMHARYYASTTGRFLSPDPVLGNLLQPQSWNRYAYVFNNPINYLDPFGLEAEGGGGSGGSSTSDCQPGEPLPPDGCHSTVKPKPDPAKPKPPPKPRPADYLANVREFDRFKSASLDRLRQLLDKPWVLSGIFPLAPKPGMLGVGPAGSLAYNPQTRNVCVGAGLGISAGHNFSVGPLLYSSGDVDKILGGWSLSGGANLPFPTPAAGLGGQVIANSSGLAAGPTAGVAGLSASSTWSACTNLW